ncbi:C_GCAxxG_C_C family probable redox protein [Desulfosporosinus acidiphilus SJ4]|uniref:C_GCAxxG_C_C family probable redox protein n=1 Tax=Desulfosporosinus acidiphilus (strain DSM 22704 / JCM 16185 / SJ4) TaxID=646529 RepID=I4D3A2_DESAJ|nr:C-GCAxxG-C-C family protein [Desulfosporosinus acidiphilus]AFM40276.1 C_GCAxxG_C_C family probable redox protein [Desulfosporosinus acidiphilus SJ4]
MEREKVINDARKKAEGYFQRGEFFCSESVIHTLNELLGWPLDRSITRLASGFPIGIGKSGCVCGAISGGVMALGMAYGRDYGNAMNGKMLPIAAELHDHIKKLYRSTCCRVITKDLVFDSPERKAHCVKITGEVAAWVTDKLLDDEELIRTIKSVNI